MAILLAGIRSSAVILLGLLTTVVLTSTCACEPIAMEFSPNVLELEPMASASPPLTLALAPIATS